MSAVSRNAPAAVGPIDRAVARRKARRPRIAGMMALTLAAMIGGLIVLAWQTTVPQITRAPGVVVPMGNYPQIEVMDGGIVETVFVSDGQRVAAGDMLVALRNPDLLREAHAIEQDIATATRQRDNAVAILSALNAATPVTQHSAQVFAEAGLEQAAARLELYVDSQRLQAASIAQNHATHAILIEARQVARDRADRKQDSVNRVQALYDRGLVTLTALQREINEADGLRADAAEAAVAVARAADSVLTAEAGRQAETLALREETLTRAEEAEAELASLKTAYAVVQEKLAALRIAAPADGVVQAVDFPSPGAVIAPGETIFRLLPTDQSLVVEARIPNVELGHVALDYPVAVTFDSFDVRRYGKVDGQLAFLSPVPLVDEKTGESYFRATVDLAADQIGSGAFERPVQAGLTVVAEMVTGEQSLLAYALKPIQHTLSHAFNER